MGVVWELHGSLTRKLPMGFGRLYLRAKIGSFHLLPVTVKDCKVDSDLTP